MTGKALTKWEQELAAKAQAESEDIHEGGGGNKYLSIKGGVFAIGDDDLGDELDVVIVDHCYEYAWYDSPWNPDDPKPPACFAIGAELNELAPHEDSPNPQADTCAECWANEWGSSDRGTGKACKNSRRCAVLAVSDEGVATEEMPMLRIPPTSLNNFGSFVKRANKTLQRPTNAICTSLSFDQNAEWEKLKFKALRGLTQDEYQAVEESLEAAEEMIYEPFDVTNYEAPQEKKRVTKKKATPKKKAIAKKKATAKRRSKMS